MHAKMMLVWMVYATTISYCMKVVSSYAENDGDHNHTNLTEVDSCENWDVRLVGALGEQSGLLEARCDNHTWSTVRWCDYWNSSDGIASLVCRHMRYSQFNATAEPYSEECEGSAPQHFVYCEGTESNLTECNFSRNCSGSERVRVYCQPHCTLSNPIDQLFSFQCDDPFLPHDQFQCFLLLKNHTITSTTSNSGVNCNVTIWNIISGLLGAIISLLVSLFVTIGVGLTRFIIKTKSSKNSDLYRNPAGRMQDSENIVQNVAYQVHSLCQSTVNVSADPEVEYDVVSFCEINRSSNVPQ